MSSIDSMAAGIAMQQAVARRDMNMSLLKQAANQDRAVVNLLDQAVQNAQAMNGRGGKVNILA